MPRTTDEWAALLDYTTPEPWFANVSGFGRIENIGPISTGFSIGDGLDCDEHDAELAAAAPEAVAEVVRLRKAIEERIRHLRLPLCSHVPDGDELDELAEQWARQDWEARLLDRILNGDTDD